MNNNRLPLEKNPLKRAWIYLWYWDMTRLFLITGIHLFPTLILLSFINQYLLSIDGSTMKTIITAQYCLVLFWALIDNDYSQLERVGLTVDREPLNERNYWKKG